jgi:hypothetical protein
LIPLIQTGQKLPFPGEDIWAENKALKVPKSVITNSEDLRIEIVTGTGKKLNSYLPAPGNCCPSSIKVKSLISLIT